MSTRSALVGPGWNLQLHLHFRRRRGGRPGGESGFEHRRTAGCQRQRDALREVGIGDDRERQGVVVGDGGRCAVVDERKHTEGESAVGGRRANHQEDTGLASRGDTESLIEIEANARVRRQRRRGAGIDEGQLRCVRREVRVLQTEAFEHPCEIAEQLPDLRRAGVPVVRLAQAAQRIGQQRPDPAPVDLPAHIGLTKPDPRCVDDPHDPDELQHASDAEAMAKEVLDHAVVEKVPADASA